MLRTLLIAAAAIGLSACATEGDANQSARADGRDCFHAEEVAGYNVIDDHHVGIRVGASRNYVLETNWNVRGLDWSNAIAIRSDMSWICTGENLGVRVTGGDPVRTYWIQSVSRAPDRNAENQGE